MHLCHCLDHKRFRAGTIDAKGLHSVKENRGSAFAGPTLKTIINS